MQPRLASCDGGRVVRFFLLSYGVTDFLFL
jgi:hypothetical protein